MLRIIKAIGSLTAIAAILAGAPAALLNLGTNPWTAAHWAAEHLWSVDYSNTVLFGALTLTGWIAWATSLQAFLAALVDALTHGRRTLPAFALQRALFTVLLGTIITSAAGAAWTGTHHPASPITPPAVAAPQHPASAQQRGPQTVHQGPGADHQTALVHTVVRGEHLLDLAETYYGSPDAYSRIVDANRGITQPDGRALHCATTRIYPGWQLRIPHPRTTADQAEDTGTVTLLAAGRTYEVTVRRGDNLFQLAETWLGDGNRWPEIYQLNKRRHFDDGRTLRTPRLIFPGWTLQLPDDANPPGHTHPPTVEHPAVPEQPNPPTPAAPPVAPHDPPAAAPSSSPAPATSQAGPTAAGPTADSTSPQADPAGRSTVGIDLPGRGWIDAGLAAALATAAAAVWAHRNRRYRRRATGETGARDADLPRVSALIRLLRTHLAPTYGPRGRAAVHPIEAPEQQSGPPSPAPAAHPSAEMTTPEVDFEPEAAPEPQAAPPGTVEPGDALPVAPASDGPHADLWPTAGLGLIGPGGLAAARGMLIAALASGTPNDPHTRTEVIISATTLASLLGAAAVQVPNTTARLVITDGLAEAIDELEARALYRARLCQEYETVSITQFRREHPDRDFVPPLVLITDVGGEADQTRLEWALAAHYRLDVHGVVCGPWPRGDTIEVAADGTTRPAAPGRYAERHRHGHCADLGRLTVLDETHTLELLLTLIEATTGEPAPAPPADTVPHTELRAGAAATSPAQTAADTEPPPTVTGHAQEPSAPAGPDTAIPTPAAEPAAGRPVRVVVLGQPALPDYTGTRNLRGRSRELLTYLAANGGSAHEDAVLEDLMPEVTYKSAGTLLNTTCSALRLILGEIAGVPARRFVVRDTTTRTVRLGPPELLDVDLWQLRDRITRAKTASHSIARTRLLREAVDTYTAALGAGTDYPWIDLYRERVRRDYIDAVLALADELSDQPAQALQVIKPAIGACPYSEALYQHAMRAHAALGDADGIRRLRRTLARALEELGVEAEEDTRSLANNLLADLARRNRP